VEYSKLATLSSPMLLNPLHTVHCGTLTTLLTVLACLCPSLNGELLEICSSAFYYHITLRTVLGLMWIGDRVLSNKEEISFCTNNGRSQ
jgi:hypothetical protein